MKQKDRSLLYLLTFTMLLFSFSSIFADVTVTYVNGGPYPYNRPGTASVFVTVTDNPIWVFDIITKIETASGGAFGTVTAINNLTPVVVKDFASKVDPFPPGGPSPDFTRMSDYTGLDPFDALYVALPVGTYSCDFTFMTSCAIGTFTFGDGVWVIDPLVPTEATTVFYNTNFDIEPLSVVTTTVTVVNADPIITNCPPSQDLDACEVFTHQFIATDADEGYYCDPDADPAWAIIPPVTNASITPGGLFVYDPALGASALGAKVIKVRATDEMGAYVECQFTLTVVNDAPVITNCPNPSSFDLDACEVFTLDFAATDDNVCTNLAWSLLTPLPTGYTTCAITSAGAFTYDPALGAVALGAKEIAAVVTDEFGAKDTCAFTINVVNTAPTVDNCPQNFGLNACDVYSLDFEATDPNPCTNLAWSLVGEEDGMEIVGGTGVFTYEPPAVVGICGSHAVTVVVTDEFLAADTCQFTITVQTDAPTFTDCPQVDGPGQNLWDAWGNTLSGDVDAVDPDADLPLNGCPLALEYTLDSFTGPVTYGTGFQVDPVTGSWTWQTEYGNNAYDGPFTAVIKVTDGCEEALCEFEVIVTGRPNSVVVGKLHDVLQGRYAFVPIEIFADDMPIGGFDLLVAYDASALILSEVLPGPEIALWEYFTYRFGATGNCNGPCPSGLVRIVAMGDINNGFPHPDPLLLPYSIKGVVATLKFLVTNDRTYECQFVPLGFYWIDCTDNVLSSDDGQQAYINDEVWYYTGDQYPFDELIRIDNVVDKTIWRGWGGWQGILEPTCLDGSGFPNKPLPLAIFDFYDGGIDIACADSIDLRGDLNLNGIANEIADAVIYSQYFLIGIEAFPLSYRQGAIAASDINNDGTPLSVADLVYLLRVIVGDALPYVKLAPYSAGADISVFGDKISATSSETIGALYLTFNVTGDNFTVVNHTNMEVMSNRVGDKLNVLVYSGTTNLSNAIPAGTNELLTVTGAQLNSVEASDYYGSLLNTRVAKSALPTQFALAQNIPNPFNPTTKIGLDLPSFTGWQIDIYNVNGQLVQSYNGTNIGHVEVTWDAANAASGIYFYKVTAGSFTDTKKMVLMK